MRERRVRTGPLWLVTFLYSGVSIVGLYYTHTLALARVYGILLAVSLPFICLLHYIADGEL